MSPVGSGWAAPEPDTMAEPHERSRGDDPRTEGEASERWATGEVDRRRGDRREVSLRVRLKPDSPVLEGCVRDLSVTGLYVELERDLLLDLELVEGGVPVQRRVRLVRSQRMPGGRSGWALEFVDR